MVPLLVTLCIALAVTIVLLLVKASRDSSSVREQMRQIERQHHEALRTLEQERHALLNALTDAFFLVDSDGLIRFANTPACALFKGREIVNRRLEDVFLDERLSAPIRKAIERRKQVTTEVVLPPHAAPLGNQGKRGETAWAIDAGPIASEASDNFTRVLVRDITAQHQTEQVRKDFVANASHELRTPLAIINGYLENLLDDNVLDNPAAARRFLEIMQKHGKRIARIVEDMLVISKLESGEAGNLKMKPFVLEACVHDVLERLESMISNQGAKIRMKAGIPGLTITGDRFYWTQVLFNLVENALKQNPEIPLKVAIGWELDPGGALRIWVSDNGVGIPSGDLPYIFRRFYRVEKHHSQVEIKGTGLGLSIVKRAVEAHRGVIEVSSSPGQETRFDIVLPADVIAPGKNPPKAKAG